MKQDFVIGCEGDCERVAAVLVGWIKNKNKAMLKKSHTVRSPTEMWALMFEEIYTDEIVTHGLEDQAKNSIVQLIFEVDNFKGDTPLVDLDGLSDEDLLDAFRDLIGDDDDDDDDEEDDDDDV
jgi:hypothetical protein